MSRAPTPAQLQALIDELGRPLEAFEQPVFVCDVCDRATSLRGLYVIDGLDLCSHCLPCPDCGEWGCPDDTGDRNY